MEFVERKQELLEALGVTRQACKSADEQAILDTVIGRFTPIDSPTVSHAHR
jgi:hypothetical protein